MPKLSVIVPVYNVEKYLNQCIDSILEQTFSDFELIIVNDGSTDRSGEICDKYAQADIRVRVIHTENRGVVDARRTGVNYAHGEYATFVDSDDWIDPDTYYNIMSQIEKHNADMGIFAMITEKSTPSIIRNCLGEGVFSKEMLQKAIYPKMLFDYSLNQSGIIASLCNKVIKREILQQAIVSIPDNLDYGEDAISGYLCMLNASTVYVCNIPFYHYRQNQASISHAGSSVMKKRILALDREMRRYFSGYDIDMSSQISGHIARHTVEQVRSDLIYLTDKAFSQRRRTVSEFCKQTQIAAAIEDAYPLICNKKEKIKVFFIKYRFFGLLFLLFRKI